MSDPLTMNILLRVGGTPSIFVWGCAAQKFRELQRQKLTRFLGPLQISGHRLFTKIIMMATQVTLVVPPSALFHKNIVLTYNPSHDPSNTFQPFPV